jgi:hypothetical protein
MIGLENKSQLKLRSEVRHKALEHSLGGCRWRLGMGMGDRDQEDNRKDGDCE